MPINDTFAQKQLPKSWIKGFIEGEGCFMVSIGTNPTMKVGFSPRPVFKIVLHEKDKNILERIKNTYGIGKVEFLSAQRLRRKNINASDQARYIIDSFKRCIKFRDIMKKEPFYSSKKIAFEQWSKILDIMKEKKHTTVEGFLEICKIRDNMNVSLFQKHPRYRDYNWFKEYFTRMQTP